MKISIALFLVFMLFASLLPHKKCDCNEAAYMQVREFYKGKIVQVQQFNAEMYLSLKEPIPMTSHPDNKHFTMDSVSITLIK